MKWLNDRDDDTILNRKPRTTTIIEPEKDQRDGTDNEAETENVNKNGIEKRIRKRNITTKVKSETEKRRQHTKTRN